MRKLCTDELNACSLVELSSINASLQYIKTHHSSKYLNGRRMLNGQQSLFLLLETAAIQRICQRKTQSGNSKEIVWMKALKIQVEWHTVHSRMPLLAKYLQTIIKYLDDTDMNCCIFLRSEISKKPRCKMELCFVQTFILLQINRQGFNCDICIFIFHFDKNTTEVNSYLSTRGSRKTISKMHYCALYYDL